MSKANFGGADSYFNVDLTVKAWGKEVYTSIFYEDDQHHVFGLVFLNN